ncbi:hypothetical protein SEPCBS119000_000739 [Sporothrix epigloea]|uniref:Uncharacterized protein n=1 Tax=Sporothrix epigloea TaxID=1892477 RepID=A0ABP0D748_9PEZI
MATETELAPRSSGSSALLADEDLNRILELDQIVKLSEAVTAGKHPRIKIPLHLVRASPNPAVVPAKGQSNRNADSTAPSTQSEPPTLNASGTHDAHSGDNLVALERNKKASAGAAPAKPLTGLVSTPKARAVPPRNNSQDVFSSERSRLEALIREKTSLFTNFNSSGATLLDFGILLQKARQLERTFAPPLETHSNRERHRTTATQNSAAAESVDDQTFYSSNFSTPEHAHSSRIPIVEADDGVSVHDSSDYEPELDSVPSSTLPPPPQSRPLQASQQQHSQANELQLPQLQQLQNLQQLQQAALQHFTLEQLATHVAQVPSQTTGQILTSLLGPQYDPSTLTLPSSALPTPAAYNSTAHTQAAEASALLAAWGNQLPGLSNPSLPEGGTSLSSHRQVAARNPKPLPPIVRTHNLSPIAPQPSHISSLAGATQLPLDVEHQQSTGQQNILQGAPAQVLSLRKGEGPQSSPDSSPHIDGYTSEKRKAKKRDVGKRKTGIRPISPRIKPEPRSPSPIMALPVHRPRKRQRQEDHVPGRRRSPPPQTASYATAQPPADARGPLVYERVERGQGVQQPQYGEQSDYDDVYEPALPSYAATQQVQTDRRYPARPLSTHPGASSSRSALRSARAVSHALVGTSSGYAARHADTEYDPRDYEISGRMSTRPLAKAPLQNRFQRVQEPPTGRIVIDEFGRDCYESVPHQTTAAKPVLREPGLAHDYPLSRPQHAAGTAQRGSGYAMSQARYDDEAGYRHSPPEYIAPRRVFTQQEYDTREPPTYAREFTVHPGPQYPPAAGPALGRAYVMDDALQVSRNLPLASITRPHEFAGPEAPPSASGHRQTKVARIRQVEGMESARYTGSTVRNQILMFLCTGHIAYYSEQGYVPPAEEYYYPEMRKVYRQV